MRSGMFQDRRVSCAPYLGLGIRFAGLLNIVWVTGTDFRQHVFVSRGVKDVLT